MSTPRTPLDELREHLDLADHNHLASDTEIDERLDCALDCASQILIEHLEECDAWRDVRRDLEEVAGVPYIYVQVDESWYALPPLFAEVEGELGGYALSPLLPSAQLILAQLCQVVPRRDLIDLADKERALCLLVVHAFAPPVVMDRTRAQTLETLTQHARDPENHSLDELGAWGRGISRATLIPQREPLNH